MTAAPQIHLVLTDDWELRGDGSGDPRRIQFDTMRRLAGIYERFGLRGSFNVEVMQQLAHRRLAGEEPKLGELATEWEQLVRETFSRGHDIQLHLHPQWSETEYRNGHWELKGSWSLLDYSRTEIRAMVGGAKQYLESVLRPLDPDYRCRTFRSGSWCIAPSPDALPTLAELGIAIDTSVVNGLFYRSPHVTLDYRDIEEPFLPYYPIMEDARRLAAEPQPIVSVPTHSFHAGLWGYGLRGIGRAIHRRTGLARKLTNRYIAPRDVEIPNAGYQRAAYFRSQWGVSPLDGVANRQTKVSDLCGLSFFQMREMLKDARARASAAGVEAIPVVVQNHTKDIGDFAPLELFAREIAAASDIEVLTLGELARGFEIGNYPVRCAAGAAA
jgi:hypothetical protein